MSRLVDYELVRRLGRGGQAEVWLARRRGPVAQEVALKRIPVDRGGDRRASLEAEAELLATLDHVNVLRLLDVISEPEELILVTQFAPGGSVADLLARHGRLPSADAGALLGPTADALDSIHRQGIVHGDVKPANILLTADGAPLLADFGVARWLDDAPAADGTRPYVAPELLAGGSPSAPADVFALGVTAIEMSTGDGRGTISDAPVPSAFARLVADMVSEEAEHRPTANSVGDALRAVESSPLRRSVTTLEAHSARFDGLSPSAPMTTREFGPRPPARRGASETGALRWPIVFVIAVVVIVTLATLLV